MSTTPGEPWLVLGEQIDKAGKTWRIGMPMADMQTHASIVGATGSGKSTLLRNLNLQFAGLGAALIVIEPHGDLVDDILGGCSDDRLPQAVVLDLNSPCPPAFPLLTIGLRLNIDVAKQMAMSVLRVADPTYWETAGQMREVLSHAVSVILDAYGPYANVVYLSRFLSAGTDEAAFRERTLGLCSEEVEESVEYCRQVKAALEGEKGSGATNLKPSVTSAMRRVRAFLVDNRFRRSLSLPQLGPQLDFPTLMSGPNLILAPIRKSELGEASTEVFATLLMWMTIRSLMARDKAARRQVAITMDEFATMAKSEAGDLVKSGLAEARKYGASLILAMQFLAQLPQDVLMEVQTNTLTKIIMSLPDEIQAKVGVSLLAHPELKPGDVQTIEKFHFYARLAEHKAIHPACYLKALAPIYLQPSDNAESIRVPARPMYSTETKRAHQLAQEAHDVSRDPGRATLNHFLGDLDRETFQAVVNETVAANRFVAMTLLAEPNREPDRAKRAKLVSGYLYGLQWWLRDGYYMRLKKEGKPKARPQRQAKPAEPMPDSLT